MIEEFQQQLLQKLCAICPDFDQWYTTYQYQLSQDDKTVLLDTKSIIIQGASEFLLDDLSKIGVMFTESVDEILSDLYNINRLVMIYELLTPVGLFNHLTLHRDNGNIVLEQYANGLLDLGELAIAFIERAVESLGKPKNLLEAYAIINDSMVSNETFVTYLHCVNELAQHNQHSSASILPIAYYRYPELISWILEKTNILSKKADGLFQAYTQKLADNELITQTKAALSNIVNRIFSSVLLNSNLLLQTELLNNDFSLSKINIDILKIYVKNHDCFLIYYLRRRLLSSLSLPKLLALTITTKALIDSNIFPEETFDMPEEDLLYFQDFISNLPEDIADIVLRLFSKSNQ